MFHWKKKDVRLAAQPCLQCGSARTVVGMLSAEGGTNFYPRGLRWWKLSTGVPVVAESIQACLECGCLVGSVDKAELRLLIDEAGSDELRAEVARPRKSGQ